MSGRDIEQPGNMPMPAIPSTMPSRLWEWMLAAATASFVPCFVVAFHRVLGLRRRRLEIVLFAVPLVTVTALGRIVLR